VAEDLIVRDRIFITFAYNDITRMLVHQMKFRGRSDIAARLGRTVADCLYRILLNLNIATVIPVPLHPVRVRERGYNQNIIIAENFAERLKLPVRADLIRRVRNTPPQSRLSDAERKVNLIGAFAPVLSNRPNPMGMVVLIDDVFHTGSTLRGCLEALEKCGIKEVIAVTAFG